MNQREIFVPPGGPPQGAGPDRRIYERMGQDNIFRMLEDFYELLATSAIRDLFPSSVPGAMKEASKRSAAFFVSVMGGPPLYHQLYGPPAMRMRHMPFVIDESARKVWVETFEKVLEDSDRKYGLPPEYLDSFRNFLEEFSRWMVNAKQTPG